MKNYLLASTLVLALVQGAHADSAMSILKCRDAINFDNTSGLSVRITRNLAQPTRCTATGCVVPFNNALSASVVELAQGEQHTFGQYAVNQVKENAGSRFMTLPDANFELTLNQDAATDNGNTIPSRLIAEDQDGRKMDVQLVCTFLK